MDGLVVQLAVVNETMGLVLITRIDIVDRLLAA